MKTIKELADAAEDNGWKVTVAPQRGISFGDIPAGGSVSFAMEDFASMSTQGVQFTALRGGEEATISTSGYLYACVWPAEPDSEGYRQAYRSYRAGNTQDHYPEASEWLYHELTRGATASRYKNLWDRVKDFFTF